MQNFRDVADVRDVLGDTYRSFAKGPRRHLVVADFLSLPPEEQLQRVVKQGWLMKAGTINKLVRTCRSYCYEKVAISSYFRVPVERTLGRAHQQPLGTPIL